MNTDKRELVAIALLFMIIMAVVTYMLLYGSRPARQADQYSSDNNRMLRTLIADCKARGGCTEIGR